MFLWLMIAILVAVCSVAGFIYLTRRISAFGFIKKISNDKNPSRKNIFFVKRYLNTP